MSERTAHYGLLKLEPGESFSDFDSAFTKRNIDMIDAKLYLGAEAHKHDGRVPTVDTPTVPLLLSVVDGVGSIPSGRTVRYKFTWVDMYGQETAASPEATISTAPAIAAPARPGISYLPTGGLLPSGNYYYVLSAYKTVNTQETTVGERAYITAISGATGSITLTLPLVPSGATGFNVYRRSPGETTFHYLDSIDMSGGSPPATYVDSGGTTEDCNRSVPRTNTSGGSSKITVHLPGATPVVPDGYTWKIYRTYTTGDYDSSLLHWTVEQTSEGSGIVVTSYDDIGTATTAGSPPDVSEIVGSPAKINLSDETTGTLPPSRNIVPVTVNFTVPGDVGTGDITLPWVNEFDQFEVVGGRASLGIDCSPSAQDLIVDVEWWFDAGSVWVGLYNDSSFLIPVGSRTSGATRLAPASPHTFLPGQMLRLHVIQEGGGATPTDSDLVVSLLGYGVVNSDTEYVFSV